MAQYKVPQDVEADDKLLGPFNFRQFVYLLVAGGLIALGVALFQLFPLLALIPLPFVLLLAALALPLKKDQPMETYLAAIVSYYLKPHLRLWAPGQQDVTITITAPKQTDKDTRARDITGEEATHRLSFLADIVDTEGYSIKGTGAKRMNEELLMEANTMTDMFETNRYNDLQSAIEKDEDDRHSQVVQQMREAIKQSEVEMEQNASIQGRDDMINENADVGQNAMPNFDSATVVAPGSDVAVEAVEKSNAVNDQSQKKPQIMAKPSIIELANNPDFSVATISKEAKRLKERDEGEVFISLH